MKFTNGYWLTKPGVKVYSPLDVRHVVIEDKKVSLYVAPYKIVHRGMTLGGPLLNIVFTSPQEGTIATEIFHDDGQNSKSVRFKLDDENSSIKTTETENSITLISGKMRVEIQKNNYFVEYFYNNKHLTSTGNRRAGYVTTEDAGNFVKDQLDLSVGEKIYGMGERFTNFIKNGQSVDIWNEDGGTASEQAYKNIPFYLSSQNYGLFVDHTEKVSFEVASEAVSKVQFSVPGERLRYIIIGGDSKKHILEKYTSLTGKPGLPPAWSFGLWLSTSFTTDYNEETVNHFIDGMIERNIPLHVFHFDCFWMKEYEWSNFTWDGDQFPDPEGMIKRIKDKGLKTCVWINPYIGQKSPLFYEGKEKGYLLKRPNGDVWQWDLWQPSMGLVDFTNPDACKWYQDKLRNILHQGIDAFKTDFGERIPTDVAYFDGSDPHEMHNYYTQLYNQCVFDLLVEERGKNEAVLFSRSATAGGQQFPVHWGGDCDSTYVSMAESLRGGLSLTLSGFGFWSHDIGGFEATATPDVYKRWAAFGLLSTHSRLHGSNSYRVPWNFDEESNDVVRHFTNLKCSLMPYIYSNAVETSTTGVPSLRAMLLEFEDDAVCLDLDLQYMLGESILVAPIFNPESVGNYYLPKGTWTHLLSGEVREGERWLSEKYDYMSLPLFVRENTILPFGRNNKIPNYDYKAETDFHIYSLVDGKEANSTIYGIDSKEIASIKALKSNNKINITLNNNFSGNIKLINISNLETVEGCDYTKEGNNIILSNITKNITVSL